MIAVSRRAFLNAAGFCLAGCLLHGCRSGKPAQPRPRPGKLRLALIGAGSQGRLDVRDVLRYSADRVEFVALCDPDSAALKRAVEAVQPHAQGVQGFADYRAMFKAVELDAVIIATPDHHHAYAATLALKRGCAVYLEPPLTRTLAECRALERLAADKGAVLMLGDQGAASDGFRHGVNLLEAGVVGDVAEVWAWSDAPAWPQSVLRPEGADAVPESLNWDLWLGGAPWRPYKRGVYHTGAWRGWYDFGTGALGSAGTHLLGLPFRGLGIRSVERVDVAGLPFDTPESYPATSRVRFTCQTASGKQLALNWLEAGQHPPAAALACVKETFGSVPTSGCMIIGSKGRLFAAHDRGEFVYAALAAESRFEPIAQHPQCKASKPEPVNGGRIGAFLAAVAKGSDSAAEREHAAGLTRLALLGCLAQRTRVTLTNPAADALKKDPSARKGWR